MTQPTRPSAGAYRAAASVWEATWPGPKDNDKAKSIISDLAHIIDRETSVVELLEAAKACVDLAAVGADLGPKTTGAAKIADADVARLKQAISKCESGTGSE